MAASSHHHIVNPFPTAGRELLVELKRQGNHLPAYNAKLVRECFNDLRREVQVFTEQGQASEEADGEKTSWSSRPSILFHNSNVQRHKRCLLAYHKHRMELLKQPGQVSTNGHELAFAKEYQDLRELYSEHVFDLDLVPPTSHMVQVRVLQDMSQVVLESGRAVSFTKGSWLYLPRSDVLEFLQAGVLELMDGEEVDF